jgi:hypothetical protein
VEGRKVPANVLTKKMRTSSVIGGRAGTARKSTIDRYALSARSRTTVEHAAAIHGHAAPASAVRSACQST